MLRIDGFIWDILILVIRICFGFWISGFTGLGMNGPENEELFFSQALHQFK
jgi:hypothetical protein